PRPTLTGMPGQLRESQTAIGIRPKSLGIVLNRSRRRLSNGSFILRRRRAMRNYCLQRFGGNVRTLGLWWLNQRIGESSLDTLRGISFNRNITGLRLKYFVFAQVEACKRNRSFRNPSRCLQCAGILGRALRQGRG